MAKREIGYSMSGGHRPHAYISALGDVTTDEIAHVAIGAGFAIEVEDAVEVRGENARLVCESWYRGLGGGALRETQAHDARRLRDVAKEAIRAAGFKPVRL